MPRTQRAAMAAMPFVTRDCEQLVSAGGFALAGVACGERRDTGIEQGQCR